MDKKTTNRTKPENRKYSGKGRSRKFAADKRDSTEERYTKSRDNDVSWYAASKQLTADVASFNYSQPAGLPFSLDPRSPSTRYAFPGVLSIYCAPAPGVSRASDGEASPINYAAQKLYSNIRMRNSGAKNYDPADLIIYLLAMDSAISFAAYMIRAYGILNSYNQLNRVHPDGFLSAMGLDAANLKANLADFRAYINMYVMRLNAFCVPSDISYITRHFWMYSGIYADENTPKAQFYMYNPAYLYTFDLDATTGAGKLTPQHVSLVWNNTDGFIARGATNRMSFASLRTIGDKILRTIVLEEDCAIISGDILKAYEGKIVKLNQIDASYAIAPTYSEEVLGQIHNTCFTGSKPCDSNGALSMNGLSLTQDPGINRGNIVFEPKFLWGGGNHINHILDTWKSEPTPEDNLVWSRNMITTELDDVAYDAPQVASLASCGSDYCLTAYIYTMDQNSGAWNEYEMYKSFEPITSTDVGREIGTYMVGCFNERPHRILWFVTAENKWRWFSLDGEFSNFMVLDHHDIEDMHMCSLLSMFGVPYLP